MASRFLVRDRDQFSGGFDVTDTTSGTTTTLQYNYTGTTTAGTATTWDFAPLCEQEEVDQQGFNNFRTQLHQDDNFVEGQIRWNNRLEQYHQHSQGNGWTSSGLHNFTWSSSDTTGSYWITSDVGYWHNREPTFMNRLIYQLEYVIPHQTILKTDKLIRPLRKLSKWLNLNPTAEDHQRRLAEESSIELLKGWLKPKEFKALMDLGELEIHAEDVVYIVKKNPHEEIIRKKDGKEEKFCIIPTKMGWATGDILLSKILMLKTDPAEMERVAIKRS